MKYRIKAPIVCQKSKPTDVNHVVVSLVHKKSSFSMKTMQNIGGQVTAGNKSTLPSLYGKAPLSRTVVNPDWVSFFDLETHMLLLSFLYF
jgi:hypothetical protein